MASYSILSYNFNGYDLLREPLFPYNGDLVYVTDRNVRSKNWSVIMDGKLKNADPVYAAYYVRYHPFEYISSNVAVIVDSSIQINDDITPIVDAFIRSGADMTVMCTSYRSDEDKLEYWRTHLKRLDKGDMEKYVRFISGHKQSNELGSIGLAFQIVRNNERTRAFLDACWNELLKLGNGAPARLDEVIVHKMLKSYMECGLSLYIVSIQIIQSSYMTYMMHNTTLPVERYPNYDQMCYLCNMPVYPHRFDKKINFGESYLYKTEAMLLTRHLNPADLDEWLDWHLNRCKFDRIHIFDNESPYDIKSVIGKYGEKITYELVEGAPRQYRLYDRYVNYQSNAEWIMPIDDDEYLDIGKFNSIYSAVLYYRNKFPHMDMLGVRWKHLFPKELLSERNGKVLDYCTEMNPELAMSFTSLGDGGIKTIVRRCGAIHYEETWENPAGGHVPKNSVFLGALLCNGVNIRGCGVPQYAFTDMLEDEGIRLLHCRYKGLSHYKEKMSKGARSVSDAISRERRFKFDDIMAILIKGAEETR